MPYFKGSSHVLSITHPCNDVLLIDLPPGGGEGERGSPFGTPLVKKNSAWICQLTQLVYLTCTSQMIWQHYKACHTFRMHHVRRCRAGGSLSPTCQVITNSCFVLVLLFFPAVFCQLHLATTQHVNKNCTKSVSVFVFLLLLKSVASGTCNLCEERNMLCILPSK